MFCLVFFLTVTCRAATALGYNRLISSEQVGQVPLLSGVRRAVFKSPSRSFCLVGVLHVLWKTDCSEYEAHCFGANICKTRYADKEIFQSFIRSCH